MEQGVKSSFEEGEKKKEWYDYEHERSGKAMGVILWCA